MLNGHQDNGCVRHPIRWVEKLTVRHTMVPRVLLGLKNDGQRLGDEGGGRERKAFPAPCLVLHHEIESERRESLTGQERQEMTG